MPFEIEVKSSSSNTPSASEGHSPMESDSNQSITSTKSHRYRILSILAAIVFVVGIVVIAYLLNADDSLKDVTELETLNFATVITTDLIQETSYDGVLGSIKDDPVKTKIGGTITKIPEPGDTIEQGEALFTIDDQPVLLLYGEMPVFRDFVLGESTFDVKNYLSGTITRVADRGTVIQQGDVIFRVGDQPIIALYGDLPAYRSLYYSAETTSAMDAKEAIDTATNALADANEVLADANEVLADAVTDGKDAAATQAELIADAIKAAEDDAEVKAELVSTARETLDDAVSNYSDQITGWFGSIVAEDDRAIEPTALFEKWGLTVDEIFKSSVEIAKSPDDDVSTPWNELVVWVWTHLTPYPIMFDCENSQASGRCPSAEIQAAWDAKIAAEDLWLDALENEKNAAETQQDVVDAAKDNQATVAKTNQTLIDTAESSVQSAEEDIVSAEQDIVEISDDYDEISANLSGVDVQQLERALIDLGFDADGVLAADEVFTLETASAVRQFQMAFGLEVDGILDLGEIVFLPGPSQVVSQVVSKGMQTTGTVVRVTTGEPAAGTDILQLEKALLALQYDAGGKLEADGVFTLESIAAIIEFQNAGALEVDGIIDLGEVVFLPGAARVTDQLTTEGNVIGAGSNVLDISFSPKVVRMDLPSDEQGLLIVGSEVVVELPDQSKVPASVISVSNIAENPTNGFGLATFDVVIELSDSQLALGLDEAPVEVIVVSDSVVGVMAVPVSALVALLEGGYAVELDTGNGTKRYVGVETGFFGENGMIEIVSPELEPGDRVVIP